MTDRAQEIDAFLDAAGWSGAERRLLAADASFRCYHRIERDGEQGAEKAVLMDAPPEKEDVRPWVGVARHLCGLGYSAPGIIAEDTTRGLVLIEDLGDDTYTTLLARGEDETPLYELAVDLLIDMHGRPSSEVIPAGLPPYSDALFLTEAEILTEYFLPAALGTDVPADVSGNITAAYRDLWRGLLPLARGVPETLVLRDYHVDNLMRLPGRAGVGACGLLDFQDAVVGPVTYDFMSLVEDARRDIPEELVSAMRTRYLAGMPDIDAQSFDVSRAVLGAQRHCKVIGIFTRLCVRDGKAGYLKHIPRVWRLLEGSARHPALAPLRDWLDTSIPPEKRGIPECLAAAQTP